MVNIQGVLFLYLAVGYAARRAGIVKGEALESFINYLLKIALPCMVFNSFRIPFSMEALRAAFACLLICFFTCLGAWLLGKALYRRAPENQRSIMQYGTLISNAGFAGLPLVETAYGPQALFYASMFLIPFRIFMWTVGISLFTTASAGKRVRRVLTNPAIIAIGFGLVWMIFQLPLHPILAKAVVSIGNSTTSLSMVTVGMIIAEAPLRSLANKNAFFFSFVRLVLLPGILLVILKLLRVPSDILTPCVVLTGMPAGATTTLLAQRYGKDYKFAATCVFLSTVLSLITVPVLTIFL